MLYKFQVFFNAKPYLYSFLFVIIVVILFFFKIIFLNYVISPHSNDQETIGRNVKSVYLSNRKFSDFSSQFIPELNLQLNNNSYEWLAVWNPYDQLGRPTFLPTTYSKSFIFTHFFSFLTKNPYKLYNYLVLSSILLTSLFSFLFFKELDMHHLSCAVLSIGLSLNVFNAYWITFLPHLWVNCWSLSALWLITRYFKRKDFFSLILLSFASYCLFASGLFQVIILYFYMFLVFFSSLIKRKCRP